MNLFDIALIIILLFFIWQGFRTGLVGAIGGFLGILVGIWAGSHYMQVVATWIIETIDISNEALANIIAFVVIFLAVNIIASLIVMIINRIFHFIPFINILNKLAGAFVGLVGGILAVATFVYLLSLFPISETVNQAILDSPLANWASSIAVIVKPFIPSNINDLTSIS